MNRKVLGLLVAFLFITSIAFASVGMQENGVDNGVATTINLVGLTNTNDGSTWTIGEKTEKATAADTLVTADSGNTIVYVPSTKNTAAVFTLPGATTGLKFHLVQGCIGGINVNPQNLDVIRFLTLAAGEQLNSPATATGDSVTLICEATGYWSVSQMRGNWTNGS